MSTKLPTPTRTLVETSVGVREAARNLQKLSIHWESPQHIVIIVKPDQSLIEKAQVVINHLLKRNMIVFIEDSVFPSIQNKISTGELRKWNAEELRNSFIEQSKRSAFHSTESNAIFSSNLHALNKFPAESSDVNNSEDVSKNSDQKKSSGGSVTDKTGPSGGNLFPAEDIDLVITLGGDGTVLYTSWLFQTIVPPILPFHLGTLGFLTVFDFTHFKSLLDKILRVSETPQGSVGLTGLSGRRHSITKVPPNTVNFLSPEGVRLTLRMRLTCAIYKAKTILSTKSEFEDAFVDISPKLPLNRNLLPDILAPLDDSTNIPYPDDVIQILNDVVVDRGPSPYMSSLEVFGDGKHLTTVQADGLVVATPTGSTAYSLSAGGSMCHPEVPSVLLTPICPHTLSFRPMLLPDSMDLKIVIPHDARNGAWVSFDGRHRVELHKGDAIVITASPYPVPTICRFDQTKDWFDSLGRCLRWNERAGRQKSFVWGQGVVEADP